MTFFSFNIAVGAIHSKAHSGI